MATMRVRVMRQPTVSGQGVSLVCVDDLMLVVAALWSHMT